jgi:hypothetical protein
MSFYVAPVLFFMQCPIVLAELHIIQSNMFNSQTVADCITRIQSWWVDPAPSYIWSLISSNGCFIVSPNDLYLYLSVKTHCLECYSYSSSVKLSDIVSTRLVFCLPRDMIVWITARLYFYNTELFWLDSSSLSSYWTWQYNYSSIKRKPTKDQAPNQHNLMCWPTRGILASYDCLQLKVI